MYAHVQASKTDYSLISLKIVVQDVIKLLKLEKNCFVIDPEPTKLSRNVQVSTCSSSVNAIVSSDRALYNAL